MSDADTRTPFPDRTPDPDAGPSALAVHVAFCADLPDRTGESAAFPDLGIVRILGRCVAATSEVPVEFAPWHPVVRRTPRELDAGTISRRHLQLTAILAGLHVKLLGRGPMRIAGKPCTEGVAAPGQTIYLEGRLLLYVTRRSLHPVLRHFPARMLGAPGQPDAFGIVGDSEAMLRARDDAAHAAQGDENVLVLGETGSGKEALSRVVHGLSARSGKAFVDFNAAGLDEALAQSELFGNEKNYPNPPMDARAGLVAEADGGTLFLDEIGEMSHDVQTKLLRVLDQGGRFRHLGGSKTLTSDFRMVGATNQPLDKPRPDFVGRFKGRVIVPNLRARAEDIPHLAQLRARALLAKAPKLAERFIEQRPDGVSWVRIAPDLLEALLLAEHPLNVRGLDTVLWEAMGRSVGSWIRPSKEQLEALAPPPVATRSSYLLPNGQMRDLEPSEVLALRGRINGARGAVREAAAAMGISRFQLRRLMARYEIAVPKGEEADESP
jgi:two-component system nitrogen regulation response regulator GlnG/two-component system response regulator HydG